MSKVYWYCENCGAVYNYVVKICRVCSGNHITKHDEGDDDDDENNLNQILTLMERHNKGVQFATIN